MKDKKRMKSKKINKKDPDKNVDSPMDTSPEILNKWVLRPVAGADLTSNSVLVTPDSKYVVVNTKEKVNIYSSTSGQLVRSLNTGPVLAVQVTDNSQLIVASKNKVCVWNFQLVKIVKKFDLAHGDEKRDFKSRVGEIRDIFIPEKFMEMFEVFVSGEKEGKVSLHRHNVTSGGQVNKIFNSVNIGSVHIGENDNTVAAISDHKVHGFKSVTLLVYDRNLSKTASVNTDKERPFTLVKVHPKEKVVACGDSSGRILVVSGLDQIQPVKNILHWHSLPVRGLSWSGEGGTLYSGGGESVLVKWRRENGSRPEVVPRLGGPIVGLGGGGGDVTVVQLEHNSLLLVDRLDNKVRGVVGGLARNCTGWPAGVVRDRDRLVLNGQVGTIQVLDVKSEAVHSINITGQNYLSKERQGDPYNSEVDRIAVSECGQFMVTVDSQWSDLPRTLLRFWTWDPAINNFSLNTQVDSPHLSGISCLFFQPAPIAPLLLSVGGDKRAKLWSQSGTSSWSCVSCITFRDMSCSVGQWSSDGTVIALAFSHIVTLWDYNSRLMTTLSVRDSTEIVQSVAFGSGPSVRLLSTATHTSVTVWDMLTFSPIWSYNLIPSPHITLVSCPNSHLLAVVQKDQITILSTLDNTEISSLASTNCTGGTVWLNLPRIGPVLYFLTYAGQLMRLGPPSQTSKRTPLITQPSMLPTILQTPGLKSNVTTDSTAQWDLGRNMDDIEEILSLPLHTVPPPSQLKNTLVKNRLLALPRMIVPKKEEKTVITDSEDQKFLKKQKKIENVFRFDHNQVSESLDLKSFCKLLKTSNIKSS